MLGTKPVICPKDLLDMAKKCDMITTAVVNISSIDTIKTVKIASDNGFIKPILIGDYNVIKKITDGMKWSNSNFEIIDSNNEVKSAEIAVKLIRDNKAYAIMKGDIHTDIFMAAIVNKDTGIRGEGRLCHAFYMTFPDSNKSLIISDCAVNIAPNIKTKQAIIKNSIKLSHILGNQCPKVAIISATEDINASMQSSIDADELSNWAKDNIKNAVIHGPMALDNAISPQAAAIKNIVNPVAGNADITIMPNIEAGNIFFKSMVYYNNACAAGIVMGAKVPIILNSRADPFEAKLASIAIAVIMAKKFRR